jgi:hemerythrin-like domain-containing protein
MSKTTLSPVRTEQPDLGTYHAVHTALRGGAHLLAGAASTVDPGDHRRTAALARYWKGYAGEVLAHHTVEDEYFFPALAERVPAARGHLARLASEHAELDYFLDEARRRIDDLAHGRGGIYAPAIAGEVLGELARHMDAHLDFEDAEILPLFEAHFSVEEYERLDECAMKSLGITAQAAFTVPFVLSQLEEPERSRTIGAAPLPFRVLYHLTRGRHARLVARAFPAEVA